MDTQKQNAKRSKVQTICRTGERKKPLVEVSIAVLLTLLVAWIFYNAWYGLLWFPVVYLLSSRIYREEKQAKEGQRKNRAFKELLELLSGFLQAGMSLENSFLQAEGQLAMLGEDGKDMIYALHQMNQKVKVNIAVEQAYMELAEQMDLEEACAFGEILLFAKRLGGNYGKNIQRTATKLGDNDDDGAEEVGDEGHACDPTCYHCLCTPDICRPACRFVWQSGRRPDHECLSGGLCPDGIVESAYYGYCDLK